MNNNEYKYHPVPSTLYKKNYKKAKKQGLDIETLKWGVDQLARDIPLPSNWNDHRLINFKTKSGIKGDFRECYIGGSGDWLLVYEKQNNEMILYLYGTGSHGELLNL